MFYVGSIETTQCLRKKLHHISLSILALLVVISGCSQDSKVVEEFEAKVKSNYLTTKEVDNWVSSLNREIEKEERQAFVQRWIEEELLYQTALDEGILNDKWFVSRLDEIKRKLLISRYLDLQLSRVAQPSQNQIRTYYQQHTESFVFNESKLLVFYYRSKDASAMEKLRNALSRNQQVSQSLISISDLDSGSVYLYGEKSSDPEIWNVVSELKVGEISPLTRMQNSHWLFVMKGRSEAGETPSIDEVKDQILAQMMEEMRRERRSALIRNLMDNYRMNGDLVMKTE